MKKKLAFLLSTTALLIGAMSTGVLAADTYDMTTAITSTVGELTSQFTSLLAIIVPGVLLIVGGKLVVTKGISWFKALAGKA